MQQRTHASQLPTNEEIKHMMESESQRPPTVQNHFTDFSTARAWLAALDLGAEIFDATTLDEVANRATVLKPLVVKRTVESRPLTVLKSVEQYLAEEDVLTAADVAIVFGGRTVSRAEKGAELYLQGYVPKLLMTGKSPNYTAFFSVPEAQAFATRAIELGVPEQDIWTEQQAINIADNVKRSLDLLDQVNYAYSSVIQVISWYANRRAWCTLKKHLDPRVTVIRVNAPLPEDSKYKLGEWYKTDVGIEVVFNEFVKMKHHELTDRS